MRNASAILLACILSACGTIQIQDSEWCADLGDLGASCKTTLSGQLRRIEKADWDKERFGQVCTTSDTVANLKAAVLKLCNQTKRCTYEKRQMIETAFKHVEEQIQIAQETLK